MRRFIKLLFVLFGLMLVILYATKPDEDDYKVWLAEKYDISCEELTRECKHGGNEMDWQSRHTRWLPIYTHVIHDRYVEDNKEFVIRAFGILNHFFDYSKIHIYD